MKARIGNRSVEIGVRGGVVGTRGGVVEPLPRLSPEKALRDTAGSNPASSPSFDSKWEERFAKQLEAEKLAGHIIRSWYHPFSMWLPGKVRYTPDFMIQHTDGLELVDVKGWHKNIREAMVRIKIAASIYPCYRWTLVRWSKQGFTSQQVDVEAWG